MAAVRSKRDASIVQAAAAVGDGRADALVSAGSTGPTLAAGDAVGQADQGRLPPGAGGADADPGRPVLLLDAGASVEVRPEHLVQFAYMGAGFMEAVVGIERPSVGLLSVGEESGKGTPGRAHRARPHRRGRRAQLRGQRRGLRHPARAGVDVVVADGFTGNVALKVLESTLKVVGDEIRSRIRSGPVSSLGGLLIRGKLGELRDDFDPEKVGGAILLGLRKPVVVAHGSFGPTRHRARRASWPSARWTRTWSAAPRRRSRRPGPCGPRALLASPSDDPRRGSRPHPRAPGHRAGGGSGPHRRVHSLPGGPGGGLARPGRAGRGAGGQLRRPHPRRGGGRRS